MKILGDRVLVRPDKPATIIGNIVLPEAFVDSAKQGTVIVPGEKSTIPKGAQVVYMEDDNYEIEYNDEPHLVIKNERIYAVL